MRAPPSKLTPPGGPAARLILSAAPAWVALMVALMVVGAVVGAAGTASAKAGVHHRARSLGDNSTGRLEGGRSLPLKTPSLRVISRTIKRGFTYGTDELVGAIVGAADAVREKLPGAVLQVGNLSREGGGDIGPSRSHNSGRDADIAFYLTDAAGKPAHPDGLVALGRDGRSRDGRYRLDLERSWALVRTLLADDRVQLEWAFCAAWLRGLLLDHARAVGEDPAVVVRAETVLKQPSDSSPHDDHFHVRVYCAAEDRAYGCSGYGATWPWADPADEALDARARALAAEAVAGKGAARAKALDTLVEIRGRAGVPGVLPLLADGAARGRVLALVRATHAGEATAALVTALGRSTDPAEAVALIDTLASVGGAPGARALAEALVGPSRPAESRVRAARALGTMEPEVAVAALPSLAAAADGADPAAEQAALALSRLTNRPAPAAGAAAGHGAHSGAAHGVSGVSPGGWSDWVAAHAGTSRDAWVTEGFAAAGIRVEGSFAERVDALVGAVASRDAHVSWNAQHELARMTGLDLGVRGDAKAAARAWGAAWASLRPSFVAPPRAR